MSLQIKELGHRFGSKILSSTTIYNNENTIIPSFYFCTKYLFRTDNKYLKENCHGIEKVFEKRKCGDTDVKLDNSKIMYKLFLLLCCGDAGLEENQISQYVTRYICSHGALPIQLVQIIAEGEDLQTCTYAIDILYKLLVNSNVSGEGDRTIIKKNLSVSTNFTQLLESMYSLHARFCENSEYRDGFLPMHTKLLHMILTIYEVKKCPKYITSASKNTVRFIGQLIATYYKHKELTNYLLAILRVLCFKKKHSQLLASKRFFDSICYSCKLTQKIFAVALILKLMSRNATALNCMSRNERIFNLILDLANYSGKKPVNKRTLMTTLYRMTRNVHGLKLLSKMENFEKLLNYFLKNEKPNVFHHRMGTIKAYTILNRAVTKTRLPSMYLNMGLQLPEDDNEDSDSEESEQEVDGSDEESPEVECLDEDSDCLDEDLDIVVNYNLNYFQEDIQPLSKIKPLYKELLECEDNPCYKLGILEDVKKLLATNVREEQMPWQDVIENRVCNIRGTNRQAYPDALMLQAHADEHYLNPSTNHFCVNYLAKKLKCAKGISESKYIPRIVYNLDELFNDFVDPATIPHPNTFTCDASAVETDTTLKFESRFECGNLRSVKQIEEFEYELLLSPDTHSCVGHQWFYFQISNTIPGIVYTFNIINFIKINSQYNYGMQPVVFSVIDYKLNGIGWRRAGDKIIYYGNNYTDENGNRQYRTLSFCMTFRHSNDYVYLAYHYPYTYTRLMTILLPIACRNFNSIYARVDKLCDTVNSNNEVPLLTVTAALTHPNSLHIPLEKRPLIFITSRVHPGETNSSWIMEGIINFLLDEVTEQAIKIREHFIFKIVPMLNPEGVIYGNTRSGLTGADLNRCWSKPNQLMYPEIYHAKRLIEYAKRELQQPVAMYLDIHGHSRKKHCFFYGCNPKLSWSRRDRKYKDCTELLKLLPQMVQMLNPHMKLISCKNKIQRKRESTGRVVMWREFGISHSYTLECSYCSGANQQTMNTKILTDVGASILVALGIIASRAYTAKEFLPSFSLDYRHPHDAAVMNAPINEAIANIYSDCDRSEEIEADANLENLNISSADEDSEDAKSQISQN